MVVRGVIDEDFVNYKDASMFISSAFCDFKCEKESGVRCCQNSALAQQECVDIDIDSLINRYLNNNITKAICFGGLEPFEQYEDLLKFIELLRCKYHCSDMVVVYTGFNKSEILYQAETLRMYGNIIIKFGRFVPNQKPHFDEILGVNLASPNQYAEVL